MPYVGGIDLNCGCPQSWACAETLGAALMNKRELVRDMVVETRQRLASEGWGVGMEKDIDNPKGRSVSVKIRVHDDLRYVSSNLAFAESLLTRPQQENHGLSRYCHWPPPEPPSRLGHHSSTNKIHTVLHPHPNRSPRNPRRKVLPHSANHALR